MKRFLIAIILALNSITASAQNFGWVNNPALSAKARQELRHNHLELKRLVNVGDDREAFNYRFLFEVLKQNNLLTPDELASGRLNSLNQGNVGSCFMKDALITLHDGSQKKIQDVKIGDHVLTAEGNIKEVIDTFKRYYDGNVITLKLWGHSGVTMTEDHLVYTRRGYIPANRLTSDDMVGMPRRPIDTSDKYIEVDQFVQDKYINGIQKISNRCTTYKQVINNIAKTGDIGWILGLYLAEGSSDGNKVIWTLNINERNTHIQKLSDILNTLNIQHVIIDKINNGRTDIVINSNGYSQLFIGLCGKGSFGKNPHSELLNGPREYLEGIYRGWLDGDGHARRNGEHGKTISPNIAFAMLSLDIALGNNSSISKQKGVATGNVKHRYDSYQVGHVDSNSDSWRVLSEDKIIWRKVRSLDRQTFSGDVYNLEVEDDHSFVNYGIAFHNCVGYSTTRAFDITRAADIIFRHENEEWNTFANPDAIYGITRQDNLGSWDGSTGAWAAQNLNKYGSLYRLLYGNHDLRNTSPQDGRKWARTGLEAELLKAAIEHRAINCSPITSIEEAKAAIQNGYAIIICAEASYPSSRDSNGFLRRNGKAWAHAMLVSSYRNKSSGREGFLIHNSWGNTWVNGPFYPEDMPHGSFWVSPEDLQFHLSQQDSYAIAGIEGFKSRAIDWFHVFNFDPSRLK